MLPLRDIARWMMLGGLTLLGLGAALWGVAWLGLKRLPGDIVVERPGLRIYMPLGTSLALSVGVSLLLWLLGKINRP
jgi:hypothetical protein